jgi:uncharacterized protein with HEPN domain
MSKRTPKLLVEDIIDSSTKILNYTDYSIVWEIRNNYLPQLLLSLKSLSL